MIHCASISKRYEDRFAVRAVSLTLNKGERLALIGPSGCGKSTLMRMVMGLIEPNDGTIEVDSEEMKPSSARKLRFRMGYMVQGGGLFPHLTIGENVSLTARYIGWDKSKIANRLNELGDLVHLSKEQFSRFPNQLSGGQQQRAALIRALFLDPPIILLDEPMGALDPLIRAGLQEELRKIFDELEKTVLLVTHDISEAGFLCEQLAVLREGELLQRGSLEDLVKRPADPFVSEFINAQRSPLESIGGNS